MAYDKFGNWIPAPLPLLPGQGARSANDFMPRTAPVGDTPQQPYTPSVGTLPTYNDNPYVKGASAAEDWNMMMHGYKGTYASPNDLHKAYEGRGQQEATFPGVLTGAPGQSQSFLQNIQQPQWSQQDQQGDIGSWTGGDMARPITSALTGNNPKPYTDSKYWLGTAPSFSSMLKG